MFGWKKKEAAHIVPEQTILYVGDEFPEGHIPVRSGRECVKQLEEHGVSVSGRLHAPIASLNLLVEAFRRIDELEKKNA